jgi:hypothetical protein
MPSDRWGRAYPGRGGRAGTLLVLASLAACAPPPPPPPPAPPPEPPALAYTPSTSVSALYLVADTARLTFAAGTVGGMAVTAAFQATAEVELGPAEDGELGATVRFPTFRGTFESPPFPPQQVDERGLAGQFRVRLDPRGRLEVAERPAFAPELQDVTGPDALVRPLFVQLPGRAVVAGDVWVDTILSAETGLDSETQARTILTTTLQGDTLVAGRELLVLRTRAENRIEVRGRSGGAAFRQLLTGETVGTVLWDPADQLVLERHEEGAISGSLDLPEAEVSGIPVAGRVRRTVRLTPRDP